MCSGRVRRTAAAPHSPARASSRSNRSARSRPLTARASEGASRTRAVRRERPRMLLGLFRQPGVIRSASSPTRSRSGPDSFRSSRVIARATASGERAVGDMRSYAGAAARTHRRVRTVGVDRTRPLEGARAEIRLDEAGLNRDDPDAEVSDLEVERPRQPLDGELRGAVRRRCRERAPAHRTTRR